METFERLRERERGDFLPTPSTCDGGKSASDLPPSDFEMQLSTIRLSNLNLSTVVLKYLLGAIVTLQMAAPAY